MTCQKKEIKKRYPVGKNLYKFNKKDTKTTSIGVILALLLLTLIKYLSTGQSNPWTLLKISDTIERP